MTWLWKLPTALAVVCAITLALIWAAKRMSDLPESAMRLNTVGHRTLTCMLALISLAVAIWMFVH